MLYGIDILVQRPNHAEAVVLPRYLDGAPHLPPPHYKTEILGYIQTKGVWSIGQRPRSVLLYGQLAVSVIALYLEPPF